MKQAAGDGLSLQCSQEELAGLRSERMLNRWLEQFSGRTDLQSRLQEIQNFDAAPQSSWPKFIWSNNWEQLCVVV